MNPIFLKVGPGVKIFMAPLLGMYMTSMAHDIYTDK